MKNAATKLLTNIKRKQITTDQKIKAINVLLNTKMAYSFNNVDVSNNWINEIQAEISQTIY